MESYKQMWMSLRNGLSMKIREYEQADNIAGLDDYGLTELDAWEGIMQEIEGLERELEENNRAEEKALEFAEKNGLDIDESYPRSDWWKFRDERDSFRKQRDELINDMAEVKKKAEAWDKQKDELREMVTFGCHFEEDTPSKYMNVAYRIVLKIMCELDGTNDFKNLLSDLERGSDESRKTYANDANAK